MQYKRRGSCNDSESHKDAFISHLVGKPRSPSPYHRAEIHRIAQAKLIRIPFKGYVRSLYIRAQSKLVTRGIIATSGDSSFLSIVTTRNELDNFPPVQVPHISRKMNKKRENTLNSIETRG
jgi:hypothetical protein